MAKKVYTTADGDKTVIDLDEAQSVSTGELRPDQKEMFDRRRREAQNKVPPDQETLDGLTAINGFHVLIVVINGQRHAILTGDSLEDAAGIGASKRSKSTA